MEFPTLVIQKYIIGKIYPNIGKHYFTLVCYKSGIPNIGISNVQYWQVMFSIGVS